MVKADGFNKEEMKAAFTGSWGAFVNTNAEDPVINSSLPIKQARTKDLTNLPNRASTNQAAQMKPI